jgi:hypothetical protein
MTPIAFTLTEADMLAGNRLAIRRYARKGVVKFALWVIAISLAVSLFAFAMATRPFVDALLLFAKILGIYTAIGLIILVIILTVTPKQRAKKNFKQMPALSRGQTVSWDDTVISFASEYGNASIPLAELYQWAADGEIVIVYPADHLFYMLPARVFEAPGDRERLIATLEASGVKRI